MYERAHILLILLLILLIPLPLSSQIVVKEGNVEIPNRFVKYSVYISAQQTGYRRLHLRTVLPYPSMEIDIRLPVAPIEIEGALISEKVQLIRSNKDTSHYMCSTSGCRSTSNLSLTEDITRFSRPIISSGYASPV